MYFIIGHVRGGMHNDPVQLPSEVLDGAPCWDLLHGVSVGDLAVLVNRYPEVFPINYKADQESVVFRTGEGTKLRAAGGPLAVALEADGHDDSKAWSVLVKGKAVILEPTQELLRGAALTLFPGRPAKRTISSALSPLPSAAGASPSRRP